MRSVVSAVEMDWALPRFMLDTPGLKIPDYPFGSTGRVHRRVARDIEPFVAALFTDRESWWLGVMA